MLAHRNVEIELGIALVGLRLAQIPRRAGAAHHDAGKSPRPGLFQRHHADIDIALLEDAVLGEQHLEVVASFKERIAKGINVVDQFRRQILMHAADAEVGRVQARARGALVEAHELLALLKTPQRRRERADVECLGGDIEKMRQ